jgi:Reverse transcriptase (RNA-dependent DNA polymerase)/gag-polypeptide of LTR copia-type
MADDEDNKHLTKTPTFNGKKSEWEFFKVKLESYLAQKDMAKLLRWDGDIPKDDEEWTSDEKKTAEVKDKIKIRAMNTKAAGILLQSIVDTDTPQGKTAFNMVSKHISAKGGYASGNFKLAWSAMTKRYENKNTTTTSELYTAYYTLMMEEDEKPDDFITKMEKAREKLRDVGEEIEEQDFLESILSRLPKGDDEKNLGPYQVEKRLIEAKLKVPNNTYDLEDLVLDLLRVRKDVYGDEDDETVEKTDRKGSKDLVGEKAFAGFGKGQFKGRCHKCGKQGHKSVDCYSKFPKKNDDGQSKGNYKKNGGSSGGFKGECHYCHKPGHKKSECRKRQADLANRDGGESANRATLGEIVMTAMDYDFCYPVFDDTMLDDDDNSSIETNDSLSQDDESVSDSFFDCFGTASVPEDDDDDTVVPDWALESHEEICMAAYNTDEMWMEVEHGTMIENESVKSDTSDKSNSSGSANYYSCLSNDDDSDEEADFEEPVARSENYYRYVAPQGRRCFRCGQFGHVVANCADVYRARKRLARKQRRQERRNRKQRNGGRQWYGKPTAKHAQISKEQLYRLFRLIEKDLLPATNELNEVTTEYALPSVAGTQFNRDTWLADSGASCHMGNSDEGMFDVTPIDEPITLGNGKSLRATKVGKLRRTVKQVNGDTVDIVLEGYKCVPGLHMNLFAVVKALDSGWDIGNEGIKMYLRKNGTRITFDRIFNTATGSLCGVEILPRSGRSSRRDVAVVATEGKQSWDVNTLHRVFNHAHEETLRKTAAHYGWTVTGKFEACADCQMSNIKQKPVPKTTSTKSEAPGERVFIDLTSVRYKSLGGSKFWMGCVDDATDQTWSSFLKRKSDLPKVMMGFLRRMKARGTPVKYIRCDNAGENNDLRNKCQQSTDLNDIEFEFTARDSPQFNGKMERKFATLIGRVRAMMNAAKLTQELRNSLWCEAASTATDVENLLIGRNEDQPARLAFFKKDLPKADNLKQFGEMAIIKMGGDVKGKLTNRGIPVMYLGRQKDHAGDTFRFLNIATKRVLVSRDAIWLNKVYGEYKGSHRSPLMDTITVLPSVEAMAKKILENKVGGPEKDNAGQDDAARQQLENTGNDGSNDSDSENEAQVEAPRITTAIRSGMHTRSKGRVGFDITAGREVPDLNSKIIREMKKLDTYVNTNPEAHTIVERAKELSAEGETTTVADAVAMAINAVMMIDKFGADIDKHVAELAMAAVATEDYSKIDPAKFKDIFENPKSFEEAWNHPDPFQREKWREAILKEFAKMERNKVWRKFKRSDIPPGRRCVKHKWVFEWKRNGTARARLVACGYSQVAGVDFTHVFSPVANDVSFRIMIICMILWKLEGLIFDVETAFLNGDLEEEIYMDCPQGMEHEPDECLLLTKTIYGLVQSARQYFKKFESILTMKMGFKQCGSDPCLFMRENEKGLVIVLCYVDDNLCIGNREALDQMLKEIVQYGLNITVENELTDYLSCEIRFNQERTKAWIGQPHMVKKLEKTFGDEVKGLQRYKTPGTPGQGLIRAKTDDDKIPVEQQSRYRTGVGMLLYLIKHSRPDICNAVRELTKCLDGATPVAYKEMMRLIKYVLDTKDRGLKVAPTPTKLEWDMLVYSDSDWAGDKDDRKSISGYMIFLNGVLVCWRSKSQQSVALSSSEAELYACSEAAKEIPFIVQILIFLGIPVKLPVQVKVDNIGAIFMTENSTSSSRTRHIDTRYFFVKDMQNDGLLKVDFVRSEDNVSDIATKNVTGEVHDSHLEKYTAERSSVIGSNPVGTGRVLEGVPPGSTVATGATVAGD